MARKKYLVIQDDEHNFHDQDGLLRIVGHALKENPKITYCRHVGFRFVVPEGFFAIKNEFLLGEDNIDVRYVDECHRWGKFYSPRQFVVDEKSVTFYSSDSDYSSEVQLSIDEIKKRLEKAKLGKQCINLIDALGLEKVFASLECDAHGNVGEIAAAWDYHNVINSSGKGYVFDRYDAKSGKVDHHISCFRGVSVIYIPINKLFSSPKHFENGLDYLKRKFIRAKEEGVLEKSDVQALVIEAEPEPQYKLV